MFCDLNKKNIILLGANIVCASVLVICAGCATTNIVDTHTYTVSSTSQQGIDALNNAANAAAKFCSNENKKFQITDRKTKYLGLTDDQKKLVHKANKTFGENNSTISDRDYKVTIKFHCI